MIYDGVDEVADNFVIVVAVGGEDEGRKNALLLLSMMSECR